MQWLKDMVKSGFCGAARLTLEEFMGSGWKSVRILLLMIPILLGFDLLWEITFLPLYVIETRAGREEKGLKMNLNITLTDSNSIQDKKTELNTREVFVGDTYLIVITNGGGFSLIPYDIKEGDELVDKDTQET